VADFAATLGGGHIRNACPCLGRIAARALSRNSNQTSCRNGRHRMLIIKPKNKNRNLKNPAGLHAFAINRKNEMKISARNRLEGKIKEVHKGATTAHVEIELKGGETVISSITNEAVEELGLKKGTQAYAVIKASDVMIAIK
jgi:molybdopterin-binding protein